MENIKTSLTNQNTHLGSGVSGWSRNTMVKTKQNAKNTDGDILMSKYVIFKIFIKVQDFVLNILSHDRWWFVEYSSNKPATTVLWSSCDEFWKVLKHQRWKLLRRRRVFILKEGKLRQNHQLSASCPRTLLSGQRDKWCRHLGSAAGRHAAGKKKCRETGSDTGERCCCEGLRVW